MWEQFRQATVSDGINSARPARRPCDAVERMVLLVGTNTMNAENGSRSRGHEPPECSILTVKALTTILCTNVGGIKTATCLMMPQIFELIE